MHSGNLVAMLVVVGMSQSAASASLTLTQPHQTITVVGEVPANLHREVRDYVQQLGVVIGDRPASRWVDPVCPAAFGLSPTHAELVVQRVRTIATSIGAPVAKADCKPNLVIAFTDNAPDMVKQISRREYLGDVTAEERHRLETGSAPIRWWYNSSVRGEDGSVPSDLPPLGLQVEGFTAYARPSHSGNSAGGLSLRGATLVSTQTMRTIEHAAVVIDVNQSQGKKLSSIIDYAALVGLAEVRSGAAPSNSILNLFNSSDLVGLTRTDKAFLKSLYGLQLARKAEQHRRVLIAKMVEDRGQRQ